VVDQVVEVGVPGAPVHSVEMGTAAGKLAEPGLPEGFGQFRPWPEIPPGGQGIRDRIILTTCHQRLESGRGKPEDALRNGADLLVVLRSLARVLREASRRDHHSALPPEFVDAPVHGGRDPARPGEDDGAVLATAPGRDTAILYAALPQRVVVHNVEIQPGRTKQVRGRPEVRVRLFRGGTVPQVVRRHPCARDLERVAVGVFFGRDNLRLDGLDGIIDRDAVVHVLALAQQPARPTQVVRVVGVVVPVGLLEEHGGRAVVPPKAQVVRYLGDGLVL